MLYATRQSNKIRYIMSIKRCCYTTHTSSFLKTHQMLIDYNMTNSPIRIIVILNPCSSSKKHVT